VFEWSVFIKERVNKFDFDALILGWQMGIEPDLYQIWHSSQTNPYQLNFVGFRNQEAMTSLSGSDKNMTMSVRLLSAIGFMKSSPLSNPTRFFNVSKWSAILDKRIVIKDVDSQGKVAYRKITPTKTGNYTFYFNRWIKLPEAPSFSPEG